MVLEKCLEKALPVQMLVDHPNEKCVSTLFLKKNYLSVSAICTVWPLWHPHFQKFERPATSLNISQVKEQDVCHFRQHKHFNLAHTSPNFLWTLLTSQIDRPAQSLKEYGLGILRNITDVSHAARGGAG